MRKKSWLLGLAAMLVVVSACTDDGKLDADDFPDTTVEPVVTLTEEEKNVSGATRAWTDLWRESEAIGKDDEVAMGEAEEFATVEVIEQLADRNMLDISRTVDNYPVVSDNGDGTLSVKDCMVWSVPDLTGFSKSWEGQIERNEDDDGYVVTSVELIDDSGCVPGELNDEILAAYNESLEAMQEYWNPADPESPLLDKTIVGDRLKRIRDLVATDQEKGVYLVSDSDNHPEIAKFITPTAVMIADCHTDDTLGFFDADGKRQEQDAPKREPGQRTLDAVTMAFVDNRWKVFDVQSENLDCEFAPTDRALPVIK